MSSAGWVKLHRQLLESSVFADADLLRLFIWLLCRAAHTDQHVPLQTGRGMTISKLSPGQSIIGRNASAETLGWKPSTFRNRLEKLREMGVIEVHSDNHCSVVSVVNWLLYQSTEDTERTTKGQPKDRQRTTKGQPKDTYKNENNSKNEKKEAEPSACSLPEKKTPKAPKPDFDPLSVEFPPGLQTDQFRDAWRKWVQYRRERRKPLTQLAAEEQLRELSVWGESRAVAAIGNSIKRDWLGIFESKDRGQQAPTAPQPPRKKITPIKDLCNG